MPLVVFPVEIRIEVLRLFEGVGDVALRHAKSLRHERCHEVPVRVVADDEIRTPADLGEQLDLRVLGVLLQVRPDIETRDPVRDDLARRVAERHAQDERVLCAGDRFEALIARGAVGLGNEARQHHDSRRDVEALIAHPLEHLALERTDLIQDVDDLPAGVGAAEHLPLPEVPVGRKDRDRKDHRDAREERFERVVRRRLEQVEEQAHRLAHALSVGAPPGLETQLAQLRSDRGPIARRIDAAQVPVGQAQRAAQLGHVADAAADHQLLAEVAVQAQELEKLFGAAALNLEEAAREPPVQELAAASDRIALAKFRELARERFEIDLEHPTRLAPVTRETLLEPQEIAHRHDLETERLVVDPRVRPARRLRAQRHVEPRIVARGFLSARHERHERAIAQDPGLVLVAGAREHRAEVALQEERPLERLQAVKEAMRVAAVVAKEGAEIVEEAELHEVLQDSRKGS